MSVRSFVRLSVCLSVTKTPKQLKINHSTLPQHSPPLTPSHKQHHNITTQHHNTTSHTTSPDNINTQHHNNHPHHQPFYLIVNLKMIKFTSPHALNSLRTLYCSKYTRSRALYFLYHVSFRMHLVSSSRCLKV